LNFFIRIWADGNLTRITVVDQGPVVDFMLVSGELVGEDIQAARTTDSAAGGLDGAGTTAAGELAGVEPAVVMVVVDAVLPLVVVARVVALALVLVDRSFCIVAVPLTLTLVLCERLSIFFVAAAEPAVFVEALVAVAEAGRLEDKDVLTHDEKELNQPNEPPLVLLRLLAVFSLLLKLTLHRLLSISAIMYDGNSRYVFSTTISAGQSALVEAVLAFAVSFAVDELASSFDA